MKRFVFPLFLMSAVLLCSATAFADTAMSYGAPAPSSENFLNPAIEEFPAMTVPSAVSVPKTEMRKEVKKPVKPQSAAQSTLSELAAVRYMMRSA